MNIETKGNSEGSSYRSTKKFSYPELIERWRERVESGEKWAEIVLVTPELASLLLERNNENRKLDRRWVNKLKKDYESGYTEYTGESVIINNEFQLNDGQHRLVGIRDSGTAQEVLLSFGASRSSRKYVDNGNKRRQGSQAFFEGWQGGDNLMAAVQLIMEYEEKGEMKRSVAVQETLGAKLAWLEKNYGDEKDAFYNTHLLPAIKAARKCNGASRGVFAALHYLFYKRNAKDADTFFEALTTGAGLPKSHSILVLREKFKGTKPPKGVKAVAEEIIDAWNKWHKVKGRDLVIAPKIA